jgi:hypothetical protein
MHLGPYREVMGNPTSSPKCETLYPFYPDLTAVYATDQGLIRTLFG